MILILLACEGVPEARTLDCLTHAYEWREPTCPCTDHAYRLTPGGISVVACRPDQRATVYPSPTETFGVLCTCEGETPEGDGS